MKLKTSPLFNPIFSFILDNPARKFIENPEKKIKLMGVKSGMKVLEVGAANGFITPYLSKQVGVDGSVISIDIQKKLIDKALKKFSFLSNVSFKTEDAANLKSIKNNEIDLIFLYYAFHEIKEKEKAVKEFYRVLKNGGILSIKEPKFEINKKDIIDYKNIIVSSSFNVIENEKDSDLLGRYIKFMKY
ncbi:MAG: class I SAM-dependent methyltransferase [Candidatus Acididesulfobacter diazotrophicus]|jgi:ubiquinone/menaquinone biosynthesis C-methylase UbiE|uniref:Class I SAM-dependent methyltransferase n=1 Tax=Candidatus Acididesulfobacter diazotrophicus TaxID=2597226 RepID=A0A519BPY9_9DELT|nr:MAG: class I SAM-dependent methyltransferase [Candidatus Acididesulfobacter diazotrophicus]